MNIKKVYASVNVTYFIEVTIRVKFIKASSELSRSAIDSYKFRL